MSQVLFSGEKNPSFVDVYSAVVMTFFFISYGLVVGILVVVRGCGLWYITGYWKSESVRKRLEVKSVG